LKNENITDNKMHNRKRSIVLDNIIQLVGTIQCNMQRLEFESRTSYLFVLNVNFIN